MSPSYQTTGVRPSLSKLARATLVAVFWVVAAAFSVGQNGPQCQVTLLPTSGTAPLHVQAIGGCIDGSASIVSEVVDWGDGTQTQIQPQFFSAFTVQNTYHAAGTYTVTVTAVDSNGTTGTATGQVVVSGNSPPSCTLTVSPSSGTAPLTVTANGTCTDPDNDITSTSINWGDGSTTQGSSGTHTYGSPGTFTVTITATDSVGNQGSASQVVTVTAAQNAPPSCVLSVAPTSGSVPLTVTANGSCSDPENDIVSTVLNWGDGTSVNASSGTHTYSASGTFHVVLTATDSAGNTGSATQTVTAGNATNAPPHCAISMSATAGTVPAAITATANCSDPENDINTTVIDFGDGFYASGGTASHTYVRAGTFTVSVWAIDSVGNTSNVSTSTVSITDTPTVFVAVSNGQVKQFDRTGKPLKTLNTNQGGTTTGMAFDRLAALYVTDFTADTVTKFNGSGSLAGNFGSGYNCQPESIAFDSSGNAYVGETGCSHAILKFDAYGNLQAGYAAQTEVEGSDWLDLAPDQCTIYYTSQGTSIFRYNACTKQQGSTFTTALTTGLGLRVLPDSSVIVADKQDIIHFDASGNLITKYTASGESCFVSVSLDPDGTSFWAVDYCSSDILHFDIASGSVFAKFNSGTAAQTVYGVALRIPPPQVTPAGPLIGSPASATVSAGQTAAVTLNFSPAGSAANQTFTLSCSNLPVGASCSFSPSTVKASGTTTVNLTISTTGPSASLLPVRWMVPQLAFGFVFLPAVVWIGDSRGRLRRAKQLLRVLLLLALLLVLLSCGSSKSGSNSSSGNGSVPSPSSLTTPANTYPVIVNARSNALSSSTVVTLTVQ